MEEQETKIKIKGFEEIPTDYLLDGHVVYFKNPLLSAYTGKKFHYMLVTGGFGACHVCSGTMILGYFAETFEDAIARKNGEGGNTRDFPTLQSIKKFKIEE